MKTEVLKRIFEFLKEKEGYNLPVKWKLINNIPLTKEELNVKGDLNLAGLEITSLPEGLKVGGSLFIDNTKITSLPEGLEVGGNLDLSSSLINSLPKGLKVGGTLWLLWCENLTSLPKGLRVGLHLDLWNSPLKKYTDDEIREMIKPGFIKGKISR